MICGPLPFANNQDDPMEVIQAVVKDPLTFPPHLKDATQKKVLQDFLNRHPDRRLGYGGVDKIFAHAFYSNFDTDALMGRTLEPPIVPKKKKQQVDQELAEEIRMRRASAVDMA